MKIVSSSRLNMVAENHGLDRVRAVVQVLLQGNSRFLDKNAIP